MRGLQTSDRSFFFNEDTIHKHPKILQKQLSYPNKINS
jgi:hypothetical protein